MATQAARVRWLGLVSAVAGALFVPYALTKGHLTTRIVVDGWRLSGLTPPQTALVAHVAEEIPLALMAAGFIALHIRVHARGRFAAAGFSVAIAGIALTVGFHLGEHLLAPLTIPALFGTENLFVWGYYASWLVIFVGFALYGLAEPGGRNNPAWLRALFVGLLPSVVLLGAIMVLLDLFTLAGTFRVALGVTWVIVGGWLCRSPPTSASVRGEDELRPVSSGNQ